MLHNRAMIHIMALLNRSRAIIFLSTVGILLALSGILFILSHTVSAADSDFKMDGDNKIVVTGGATGDLFKVPDQKTFLIVAEAASGKKPDSKYYNYSKKEIYFLKNSTGFYVSDFPGILVSAPPTGCAAALERVNNNVIITGVRASDYTKKTSANGDSCPNLMKSQSKTYALADTGTTDNGNTSIAVVADENREAYKILEPLLSSRYTTYVNANPCNGDAACTAVSDRWARWISDCTTTANANGAEGSGWDKVFSDCFAEKSGNEPKIILSLVEGAKDSIDGAVSQLECGGESGSTDAAATECRGVEDASTCKIDGLGWILCPVVNFVGGFTDACYNVIREMLKTPPVNMTADFTTNPMYASWSIMRNIANVVFVIAFLIIIFSQLTSLGISNYGVKKLLPRLVIVGLLVNVSYIICAAAVDISNILGTSAKSLFDNMATLVPVASVDSGWNDIWNGTGENPLGYISGVVIACGLAGGIALYAGLSVLLPILIGCLVAVLTVVIVLTVRQALIVLLIVVSPLAFVAFLLPNTESWFNKWRQLLQILLLMFPIIALVFGVSAFAGKIVMASSSNMLVQIMGAGITIIPLFITPLVMKTAGGLLNRIGGFVNNPNRGPIDRLRKGAEGVRKDRQNVRNMRALNGAGQFGRGAVVRWGARRKAVSSGRESEANRANTEYIAGQAQTNDNFKNSAAGGTSVFGKTAQKADPNAIQRTLANAINVSAKLEADEVNAASAVIKNAQLTQNQMQTIATGGTVKGIGGQAAQIAAIQKQAQGRHEDIAGLLDAAAAGGALSGPGNVKQREALADALASSSSRPTYVGQGALQAIREDRSEDAAHTVAGAIKANAYSTEKIALGDKDELEFVVKVANSPGLITASERTALGDNARGIDLIPELQSKVQKNIIPVSDIKSFL